MKEIKLETKCPKCEHVFLTTYEEDGSTPPQAELAETKDKLADAETNLADAAKMLEEKSQEIAHLESEEHSQEVIAHWLSQDFEDADPAVKAELGRKLGLTKMFEEAEVAEEKEPAPKSEVVYENPNDPGYQKVKDLPIWILQEA